MTRTLFLLATLSVLAAFSQGPPAFEVAAIKVNNSGRVAPEKERLLPGGRFELSNTTLKELIAPVYAVKRDMIIGGPNWIDSVRFDIVAKAPPDTPVPTLLLMVRTLLEERFKLAFHHDDKVMLAYALIVGKGGPKLQPAAEGGRQNCSSRPSEKAGMPLVHRECHNITMAEFVRQLGLGRSGIDLPIVDLTKLAGAYDFEFEYSPQTESAGPTIFDAMTQLGLKLEASKQTVPVIVIDHAEQPVN